MTAEPDSGRMSAIELRASLALASLFGLRMLGLFLVLPVFAVHARSLPGGNNPALVGLALGAYGLTQGVLHIPYGMACDRFGRKRLIVFGLVLFAAGSFLAAWARDVLTVVLGRAIQGTGAIASPVTALVADLTRERHRAKAMALIGGSIGFSFALSLVAAPALYRWIGMDGIFVLTGVLALAAIWVTLAVVPAEPARSDERSVRLASLGAVLRNADQLRLNWGVFSLHAAQMSLFVVVPVALVHHSGLALAEHWKIYLPVLLASFVLMAPPLLYAERHGRMKRLFLGAVALLLAVEVGLALDLQSLAATIALLIGFFVAFNLLEAGLPTLVSQLAPVEVRGTALGVYNTTQALGLFAGGAISGWLDKRFGDSSVFVFGIALVALWWVVALGMRVPGDAARRRRAAEEG